MLKESHLANHFTVLKIPSHETKATTVLVLAKVGSRYEKALNNGVSHFIEHLMFKGTNKRPDTHTLSKELDKVGAEYNAYTSKEYTGYYIKVNYENQELAFDMLSDLIFNSKFEDAEINKERGVITEEINMYEDNPLMYCDDLFEQLIFSSTHPLGKLIAGPKTVIKNIKRRDIIAYRDNYYFPKNMLITVAGRINNQTDKLIKKYFGSITRQANKVAYKIFKSTQTKPQIYIQHKQTEQVQLALGFPGIGHYHKDLPALNILNTILGGNMSSRLFINIREKKGLCYFVKSDMTVYEETGTFLVRSGLDKNRIHEAIKAIKNELIDIRDNGVTAEELDKAKTFLHGRIALDLEDSESQAAWYAHQKLLYNKLVTPEEKLKQYNKVTVQQIQKIAKEIINFKKANLVLIGPFNNKKEFLKLL